MVGLKHPINVQVEVTEACNHSCFYCYNAYRPEQGKQMSEENSSKLIEIINKDIKPFRATLTGGEPMLNIPVVLQMAGNLADASCSLNTNLSLANETIIKQLKQINRHLGFLVSIPSVYTGTFKEITGRNNLPAVLKNLKTLTIEGFHPMVNMVLHSLNAGEVYRQGSFLNQVYNIQSFAVTPAIRPSFTTESDLYLNHEKTIEGFRDLLRLKKDFGIRVSVLEASPYCSLPEDLRKLPMFRRGCSAGRGGIQISYDGNVRACSHSPFSEGNLIEEPFKKIWERMSVFRKNKYVPEECAECREVKSCNGGCRYEGALKSATTNKRDSRMIGRLENSCEPSFDLDADKTYRVTPYKSRREEDGSYTLFNGQSAYNTDATIKIFINQILTKGFRLNSFPQELRPKAERIGEQLKQKGFLR